MLGTRDGKLEHDFSMKRKMMGGGGWNRAASSLVFFFTEKEVNNYQIVLRFKNGWRVDGDLYLVLLQSFSPAPQPAEG